MMFFLKVLKEFNKNKIPYAVVGGQAVAFHGAVRGTLDLDFIIKWNLATLKKVEKVLKKLGLESRIPIQADDLFHFKDEYIKNKNLIAWNFINPDMPAEQVDIVLTMDLTGKEIKKIKINDLSINVLGLKDLIEMKMKAGREQDLVDVKVLKKILKDF